MAFKRSGVRTPSAPHDARAAVTESCSGPRPSSFGGTCRKRCRKRTRPSRCNGKGGQEQAFRLTLVPSTGGFAHASVQALVSQGHEHLVRRGQGLAAPPWQTPRRPAAAQKGQG